jgi:2-oxoglutarate ferredoxin oxidoreductase subunit beta
MSKLEDFGNYTTAWCPGCGNFGILQALKQALVESNLEPQSILFVSGIGQAAKTPHYLNCNFFNGLHGRAVPVAIGAKLANPGLKVIVESGDGCNYSEGGNHFIHAIRRNIDITMLTHDNQIYALTKGQASPTSIQGMKTKAQPEGVINNPFNPVAVAVAMGAGFVARGYAGMADQLTGLIKQALAHKGFSLLDIFQPCVSFNHVNTYAWYQERCYPLPDDYDPTNWEAAMKKAVELGDKIPLGVIYKKEGRPSYEDQIPTVKQGPLVGREVDPQVLKQIMDEYA